MDAIKFSNLMGDSKDPRQKQTKKDTKEVVVLAVVVVKLVTFLHNHLCE